MLGKLIKHDFKSLSRILVPTELAVLGATILATLGFAFNFMSDSTWNMQGTVMQILRALTMFVSVLLVIGIVAASILVAFIIFQRFYKNLMSSEGYLTFTLPVTTAEILWSKLITGFLWTLINVVVVFLCVNIFILFGTDTKGFVNIEVYREISSAIHTAFSTIGARLIVPILQFVLLVIVGTVLSLLEVYLALIIGGVVAQKHKVLAGVGFYFAINFAVSIITSVMEAFMFPTFASSMNELDHMSTESMNAIEIFNTVLVAVQPYYWFVLGLTLVLSAGAFILSHYFLKNKLNLE